jgi:16S rRNA (guanine527-N7)-methyltransferase
VSGVFDMIERIRIGAPRMGRELDPSELELLGRYVGEVRAQTEQVNLVSTNDRDRIDRHVLESLAIAWKAGIPERASLLDFGTGGGFPGVPIRIVRPDLVMTLLDSVRKKTMFVQHVVRELKLQHVEVIWARGEQLAVDDAYRGRFDVVTARAAGRLHEVVPTAIPLLRNASSRIITTKGRSAEEEIIATRDILASQHAVVERVIPIHDDNGGYRIVLVAPTTTRT